MNAVLCGGPLNGKKVQVLAAQTVTWPEAADHPGQYRLDSALSGESEPLIYVWRTNEPTLTLALAPKEVAVIRSALNGLCDDMRDALEGSIGKEYAERAMSLLALMEDKQ